MSNELGIIVFKNCKDLGEKVNEHLKTLNKSKKDYIVPIDEMKFNNGEGKIVIKDTIREKNIFILSDVTNYDCTYKLVNYVNHMSADDHFQDIKRAISAMAGNAAEFSVVMPYLYSARQHRRKGRESLDCAVALQELEKMGMKRIIVFDAHDPNIQNSIPCLSFENFYPTHIMLEKFIENEDIDYKNLLVISPDTGAMDRARYYADMLGADVGTFYKRRDNTTLIDGQNPLLCHEYIGPELNGQDIIIVDDMVASGESILDIVKVLKEKKIKNVYIFCTFAFFTKGPELFDKAFEEGAIKRLYTTNLNYIPESIHDRKWLCRVDFSFFLAQIINTLYHHEKISPLMNGKEEILKKIREKSNI